VTGARSSAVARAFHSAAALPLTEGMHVGPVVAAVVVSAIAFGSLLVSPRAPRALRGWLAARAPGTQRAIVLATAALLVGAAGAAGTASAGHATAEQAVSGNATADTFPHERHTMLACLVCHETGAGHGRLTFEPPRGCALCHHQAPTPGTCGNCHRPAEYGTPRRATVTITVPGREPRPRTVDFLHAKHEARTCVECHTTPVSLAPSPAAATCRDCHTEHHSPGPTCASCHRIADPKLEHGSPEVAHVRCDACHTAATIAKLTPTRAFCATCHAPMAIGHFDTRECTVCHFLAEPAAHRARLLTRVLR
jgi:hypothetical protein